MHFSKIRYFPTGNDDLGSEEHGILLEGVVVDQPTLRVDLVGHRLEEQRRARHLLGRREESEILRIFNSCKNHHYCTIFIDFLAHERSENSTNFSTTFPDQI